MIIGNPLAGTSIFDQCRTNKIV